MSIGKRLSLLVLSELITAVVVVVTAIVSLCSLVEENRYLHDFVFPPLAEIGAAFEAAGGLEVMVGAPTAETPRRARATVERLRRFLDRYQHLWQTADSHLPDAIRFQGQLARANQLHLLSEEREAVRTIDETLRSLEHTTALALETPPKSPPLRVEDVATLRAALVRLNRVNLEDVDVWQLDYASKMKSSMTLLVVVGLMGILVAPLLGLSVRQAIVPRVRLLVEKVRRFRELGVNEPIESWNGDELAVLAHALDVSFRAIVERDRERERFLAIAAHEIKTPLTTMKGFAQVALAHSRDDAIRDRALQIIDRQATRLARLTQDLLWTVRAQSAQIPFKPAPLDLEALTRRVMREVELAVQKHAFQLVSSTDAHILGDAALLEHSLWSIFTQAAALTPISAPVNVTLDGNPTRVTLTVEAQGSGALPDDLDKLLEPFVVLQFEGGSEALRGTGLGLHLVQRIARIHGGIFRIIRKEGARILFSLELQR